ncbi:MAG: hypothetical protein KBS84_02055, partial [Treponema sp.]|nr:hypothetical protein [Candidatus Treponema scatequi]
FLTGLQLITRTFIFSPNFFYFHTKQQIVSSISWLLLIDTLSKIADRYTCPLPASISVCMHNKLYHAHN